MADGRRRVVVIGASMAGLLTARVLADAADEVLVFDRDVLPDSAESRKGVPHGRHAHALLRAGELILEDLFPGLIQDLVGQGPPPRHPGAGGRPRSRRSHNPR